MSFYTPLNPVLQRELGSISADRASVFPGVFSEDFDALIEAGTHNDTVFEMFVKCSCFCFTMFDFLQSAESC